MSTLSANAPLSTASRPAWNLTWLTPLWCRVILVALLLLGAGSHLAYLHSSNPLQLAPDEAQYWVWSRNLDWSYYSKGPMVALLIRASTSLFGDSMPAVRYPAIVIGIVMTLMTYCLTNKLFRSERLALGAVALTHFVPMYIAGSLLMTIDPPFVMFWAAATVFLFKALLDDAKWAWLAVGLMVGLSFLAKYSSFFFFLGMVVGLFLDKGWRRHLRTPWPYLSVLIALLCTTPVIYWNEKHNWASAHHVQSDTTNGFNPSIPLSFLGGQLALVGPFLAIILIGAAYYAFHGVHRSPDTTQHEPARRVRMLLWTVLPYFLIVTSTCLYTNAQLNWTAPVWFAILISGAWFLSTRQVSPAAWKPWRGYVWGTVIFGLLIMPVAHNVRSLYPAFAWFQGNILGKTVWTWDTTAQVDAMSQDEQRAKVRMVRKFDPTARLLGWQGLADDLHARKLATVGPDAFLMTDDYSEAAALEFYSPGHPKTYIMGQYVQDPKRRGRSSQWDMWPDRSLERSQTSLLGKNAIYIGTRWPVLAETFERIEVAPAHRIYEDVNGVRYYLGGWPVTYCYGFKGMLKPKDGGITY